MKSLSNILVVYLVLVIFHPVLRADERSSESPLYFPPDQGAWETVQPGQVGWDGAMLQRALDYAGHNQSSGVVILHKGTVLADQQYLKEATTSSQKLNPFYGYLWWLNRNANATNGARRLETAPRDMFSANGALNRRCFVVSSLQLVVTRLGDRPDAGRVFDRQFWKLLAQASPAEDRSSDIRRE